MKLAFVILTKNSGRTLEKCLDAVAKLKDEFEPEVIVVDAGSTDNTLNIVEKYREELNIKVLYDGGRGLGYARDIGWRASSADYIVMLDSDVIVNRNFLRKAVELLQQDERLGAISAKLKPTSLDKGWVGKFQEKNLAIHLHHLDPPYPAEAVALHTACTVFRRKALEEVGGFDAYFNLAKEDSDVSYRIRKAGYKLSYLNIYALHLERARILRLNFRYGRSFILIAKKHPDMENFLRLKNIVLMVCIFIPMLQPMLYLYYLSRYVKIPHLTLSEKFILPFIELVRQDVRIVGALYQLIQNRVIR
ncbi:MAG: glycosyltransferase [Thaumarchaeota archaeon]|nr:glycosyltransferase [Candidatus Terraquivivens yellowstonensis]